MVRGLTVLALVGCLTLPAEAAQMQEVTVIESPQTGDHMDPTFAAMGMILSGMGLYYCGEKIWKK